MRTLQAGQTTAGGRIAEEAQEFEHHWRSTIADAVTTAPRAKETAAGDIHSPTILHHDILRKVSSKSCLTRAAATVKTGALLLVAKCCRIKMLQHHDAAEGMSS
jgi:hypothetical protein